MESGSNKYNSTNIKYKVTVYTITYICNIYRWWQL